MVVCSDSARSIFANPARDHRGPAPSLAETWLARAINASLRRRPKQLKHGRHDDAPLGSLRNAVARAEESLWTQRFLPLGQVGARKISR